MDPGRTARVPREIPLLTVHCVVTDVLNAPELRDRHPAETPACAALSMVVPVETLALMALAAAAQGHGRSSREPRVGLAVLVVLAVLAVGCERSAREPRAPAPQCLLPLRCTVDNAHLESPTVFYAPPALL